MVLDLFFDLCLWVCFPGGLVLVVRLWLLDLHLLWCYPGFVRLAMGHVSVGDKLFVDIVISY